VIGIVVPEEHFILGVCQLMMKEEVSRLVLLIAAILIICGQRRPQDLRGR
jgi:hypothetical protein